MSDSFADLWNSTAPTKPAEPPRTLGTINPTASGQRKPQNDVFSLLAASSTPSSTRSSTPSYTVGQSAQRSNSSKPVAVKKTTSGSTDAFSDLFSGSSSGSSNVATMTMAERAALAERQRMGRVTQNMQHAKVPDHSAQVWAGLDTLGSTSTTIKPASASSTSNPVEDDWGLNFGQPAKPVSSAPAIVTTPSVEADDWGLGDFGAPAPSKPTVPKPQESRTLWDNLEDFSAPSAQSTSRTSPTPGKGRSSTPGSFDFGDREDGLLDDHSEHEDDILGVLGKPVRPGSSLSVSFISSSIQRSSTYTVILRPRTAQNARHLPHSHLTRNRNLELSRLRHTYSDRSWRWASQFSKRVSR